MTQIKTASSSTATSSKSNRVKIGWIPYWNLLPLQHELTRTLGREVELVNGHPSQVNKLLAEGFVSMSPSSSVCLVKHANSEIVLPLGIAANGPVQSVYLGVREDNGVVETVRKRQQLLKEVFSAALQRHSSDVRKASEVVFAMASSLETEKLSYTPGLCLTPNSAASANLAKVLYRLWFGAGAYELMVERGLSRGSGGGEYACDMELLIGDEALMKRPLFKHIIDLGDVWKELTALPFVFSVWQSSNGKAVSSALKSKILEAADLAQARMRIEPCVYYPQDGNLDAQGKPVDLASYWRVIQYRFTANHFRGLALYLSLVRQLNPTVVSANALTNIMKWESVGATASV